MKIWHNSSIIREFKFWHNSSIIRFYVYRIASNKRPGAYCFRTCENTGAYSGLEIILIFIFVPCLPPALIRSNTVYLCEALDRTILYCFSS